MHPDACVETPGRGRLGARERTARRLGTLRGVECRGELRALVERVGALASFDLDELMHDLHGFARGKVYDGLCWASKPSPERP